MLRSVARLRRMAAGTSLRRLFISTTSAASMRDVRARADGDAHVRAGERGRVVDAVADHGDLAALAAGARITLSLPSGSTPAMTSIHARLRADGARGALVVAGEHDHLDAHIPQLADGLRAVRLDDVRHGDHAERVCRPR